MNFIAEMTKALAWPIALIVIGLIFKPTISGLLEGVRLRRIGRGQWSADFETATEEVRAELPTQAQSMSKPFISGLLNEETERLVDVYPAAAIAQVWNQLEDRVAAIAAQAGLTQKLLPEVLRALIDKDSIQPSTADSILGLRNMRNLAVHAPPNRLTAEQARDFITMVEAIVWTLEQNVKSASKNSV
jgi:Domain of unknown function (DUF4145)